MFTSPIGIETVSERNVRTVVLAHDAAGLVRQERRFRRAGGVLVNEIEFDARGHEAVGRVEVRASPPGRRSLRHGPAPKSLGPLQHSRSERGVASQAGRRSGRIYSRRLAWWAAS